MKIIIAYLAIGFAFTAWGIYDMETSVKAYVSHSWAFFVGSLMFAGYFLALFLDFGVTEAEKADFKAQIKRAEDYAATQQKVAESANERLKSAQSEALNFAKKEFESRTKIVEEREIEIRAELKSLRELEERFLNVEKNFKNKQQQLERQEKQNASKHHRRNNYTKRIEKKLAQEKEKNEERMLDEWEARRLYEASER